MRNVVFVAPSPTGALLVLAAIAALHARPTDACCGGRNDSLVSALVALPGKGIVVVRKSTWDARREDLDVFVVGSGGVGGALDLEGEELVKKSGDAAIDAALARAAQALGSDGEGAFDDAARAAIDALIKQPGAVQLGEVPCPVRRRARKNEVALVADDPVTKEVAPYLVYDTTPMGTGSVGFRSQAGVATNVILGQESRLYGLP